MIKKGGGIKGLKAYMKFQILLKLETVKDTY